MDDPIAMVRAISRSYLAARNRLLESKSHLESFERENKAKAAKTIARLDSISNNVEKDVLTLVSRLGANGDIGGWLKAEEERLRGQFNRTGFEAAKLEVTGLLELGVWLLVRLKYSMINPYLHRDEHLDVLMDLEEDLKALASNLISTSEGSRLPALGSQAQGFLKQVRNLTLKVRQERTRRMARSLFWPALAIVSFAVMLGQIVFGSLDIALVGVIIFLIAIGFLFVLAAANPVIAFWKRSTRRPRTRFVLIVLAMPVVVALSLMLSDWYRGQALTTDRFLGGLLLGMFADGILVLANTETSKSQFIKWQTEMLMTDLPGNS